jgi:hypothetical protein
MTPFIKEHYSEAVKNPSYVFGLSAGDLKFKASDLRDLTNEVCDVMKISAAYGPSFITTGKQVSGRHSLYVDKKAEIIQ